MTNLVIELERAEALTEECTYCLAEIGHRCINPKTGEPIEHQAAHFVRLTAAGKATGRR